MRPVPRAVHEREARTLPVVPCARRGPLDQQVEDGVAAILAPVVEEPPPVLVAGATGLLDVSCLEVDHVELQELAHPESGVLGHDGGLDDQRVTRATDLVRGLRRVLHADTDGVRQVLLQELQELGGVVVVHDDSLKVEDGEPEGSRMDGAWPQLIHHHFSVDHLNGTSERR